MKDDNIVGWFSTENGQHIPIREGESKREALRNHLKKMSRVEKNKDKYDKIDKFKRKKKSNNKVEEEIDEDFDKKYIKQGDKYILRQDLKEKYDRKLSDNNKITKMIKIGDDYIPIHEGENEEERIKDYKKRNNINTIERIKELQNKEKALQSGVRLTLDEKKADKQLVEAEQRKGRLIEYRETNLKNRRETLMKFTEKNKSTIDKWVKEYENNDDKREKISKKIRNGEPLTLKEYYAYVGSKPKSGDIVLSGGKQGEDVVVTKKGYKRIS